MSIRAAAMSMAGLVLSFACVANAVAADGDIPVAAPAAVVVGAAVPGAPNYQGLWWNAPANSESGWGINLAHQGDTIFATWFTYDTGGKAVWLAMTAQKTGADAYSGKLYSTRGPAFNAESFDPKTVVATEVGIGTLSFADADNGTFRYVIGAVDQAKPIMREVFGTLPSCTFGRTTDAGWGPNVTDMWWNSPAASEPGWGIALSHQGSPYWASTIVAVWFTYDRDGLPMWLVATAPFDNGVGGFYWGPLYRTSGARFDALDPRSVAATAVGSVEIYPGPGDNTLGFDYRAQVDGIAVVGSRTITRQIFTATGTTCM